MRRILHCLRCLNTPLRKQEGSLHTQSLRMRRNLSCLIVSLYIPLRKEDGSYTQSFKIMRRILHLLLPGVRGNGIDLMPSILRSSRELTPTQVESSTLRETERERERVCVCVEDEEHQEPLQPPAVSLIQILRFEILRFFFFAVTAHPSALVLIKPSSTVATRIIGSSGAPSRPAALQDPIPIRISAWSSTKPSDLSADPVV